MTTLAERVAAAHAVLAAEGATVREFIGLGRVVCVVERAGGPVRFSMSISRYLDGRWDDAALRRQFRFVSRANSR